MPVPRAAHQPVRTEDDRVPVAILASVGHAEDAHGFIFKIARFNALAKPTQMRYGANIHAAAAFTAENSRMVQAIDSHSATITNKPAPIFPAPKNSGAHRALSRS